MWPLLTRLVGFLNVPYFLIFDVACAHLLLLVNLPEDDVSPVCCSDAVVLIDALNDGCVEVQALCAACREPLPEGAFGRMALPDK